MSVLAWRARLDRSLQVQSAAVPVDGALQRGRRRDFEREHGLREDQAKRLIGVAVDGGGIVVEASVSPLAGQGRVIGTQSRLCRAEEHREEDEPRKQTRGRRMPG